MDKRQAIYGTVGIIAFVIGGIFARSRAIEGLEKLEDTFSKSDPSDETSAE